jgi:hypothetical protein
VSGASGVNDLHLDLAVLDGGAAGNDLRWVLQAGAVRESVDEAGRMLTIPDQVEEGLRGADEGGDDGSGRKSYGVLAVQEVFRLVQLPGSGGYRLDGGLFG